MHMFTLHLSYFLSHTLSPTFSIILSFSLFTHSPSCYLFLSQIPLSPFLQPSLLLLPPSLPPSRPTSSSSLLHLRSYLIFLPTSSSFLLHLASYNPYVTTYISCNQRLVVPTIQWIISKKCQISIFNNIMTYDIILTFSSETHSEKLQCLLSLLLTVLAIYVPCYILSCLYLSPSLPTSQFTYLPHNLPFLSTNRNVACKYYRAGHSV